MIVQTDFVGPSVGAPIMVRMATPSEIDWEQCELIERVPGKVSGRPIVRGTRILPDAIVNSYDTGETLDVIHENYPGLSISQIQRLIEFSYVDRGHPVPSPATRPFLASRTLQGRRVAMVVLSAMVRYLVAPTESGQDGGTGVPQRI